MGAISDVLGAVPTSPTFDISPPIYPLDRVVNRELNEVVDRGGFAYTAVTAGRNEVQTIVQFTSDPSAGDFTLTFTLRSGETFTTAAIAHNATGATIETAIDVAATAASVTGWTNGDITVTGGTLLAAGAPVVLTYDGASVANDNHAQATIDGTGLTGGGLNATPQTTTTEGQVNRRAWGALVALGIALEANIPVQGVTPVAFTAPSNPGDNSNYPSAATIRVLALEVAVDDQDDASEAIILAAAGLV